MVNPDYVLAPRHRFPAAPQQIYDIVCWAAEEERDWDGTRLCVGGQSAGGNLSAAAARLALENCTPVIALQVLHYAPLDLATPTRLMDPRFPPEPIADLSLLSSARMCVATC